MDQNDLNVSEKGNAIDWKLIAVAGASALGILWFNALFILSAALFLIRVLAIFVLIFAGWYSVLLICRPRRIVTNEHAANNTTWQEFMAEMQQYSPFMWNPCMPDSVTEEKTVTLLNLRKAFLGESSACLVWLLTIVFFTLTIPFYVPLYIIAALAVVPLSVSWIKYLLLYDRWPVLSQQAAKTEHYSLWLLERMQYGFVLLYCVDFACYKTGLL